MVALNYQVSHTLNSVLPILCLGTSPGSDIWINGMAKFMNPFRYCLEPITSFTIYIVCNAATTDVVVLKAAIIFPAFSFASIQVHSFNP